nr:MAG TPA: hypothetical protein [Bacteriophage sp.]
MLYILDYSVYLSRKNTDTKTVDAMRPIFNTEFINVLAYLYAWLQHVDTMLPVQRAKKDGPSPYCKKQQSEAQRFMEVKRIQIVPKNNRYQVQQCSRYRQNLQGNHICHKIADILLQMPALTLFR